ncbi:hypothetical protein SASPL_104379 [Salvia splendens]|uniref:Uncharacterized protein n=1 Tax=Salvia splendens TaxID=180675 RepID=A0A8X9A8C7_SALSN|nr:hypothetical protein SASPL_104379 [Salvia splendens]
MDYNLGALKLMSAQLKNARQTPSQNAFSLGGILFQRAWIQVCALVFNFFGAASFTFAMPNPKSAEFQGVLVSVPSASDDGESGRFLLDDGTGVIELSLSRDRQWESGMYLMVIGAYHVRAGDLPFIKVHKIVDLSPFPDIESMWYLEVIEVFKLFYEPLFQE